MPSNFITSGISECFNFFRHNRINSITEANMASINKNPGKHSTKYLNLTDYERLENHVQSEGDLLIKSLALKQADKHLTLEK